MREQPLYNGRRDDSNGSDEYSAQPENDVQDRESSVEQEPLSDESIAEQEEMKRAAVRQNGRMLQALVIGVFSLILWWLPVIGCVISTTGLVIAIQRFHEIHSRNIAYASIILNSVSLLLGLVFTGGIFFSIVHPL